MSRKNCLSKIFGVITIFTFELSHSSEFDQTFCDCPKKYGTIKLLFFSPYTLHPVVEITGASLHHSLLLLRHTYFLSIPDPRKPPLVKPSKYFSQYKDKASCKVKEADWLAVSILHNADAMNQLQE